MNELLQKLNTAHRICTEANEHYTAIDGLQQKIDKIQSKIPKRKRIYTLTCGMYFVLIFLLMLMAKEISEKIIYFLGIVIMAAVAYFIWRVLSALMQIRVKPLRAKIEEHSTAAQKIFDANAEHMAFLPADYWYPIATDYLIKMVQTGRAATLSEALDKYDEQLHRWKLEEASAQMLAMQQQQAAHLANIQRNTGISAVADVVTAAINISNRW